jgi:type II secretory pathway pseudopilin PulG
MRRFLSSITIIDCVVAIAILIILAAIVLPSFVPPAGQGTSPARIHQTATAHAGR